MLRTQGQGPQIGGLRFPPSTRFGQGICRSKVGFKHLGPLPGRILP